MTVTHKTTDQADLQLTFSKCYVVVCLHCGFYDSIKYCAAGCNRGCGDATVVASCFREGGGGGSHVGSPWGKNLGKNYATRRELELKNMITVAGIIVKSALARQGSVGAHYRSDFKEKGENWQQHISWNKRDFASPKNTPEKIQKTKKGASNL